MSQITFLTLPPSPNNTKVRMALALKGIAHESVPVAPDDRSAVLERSGQPLTPVLVDGERVVYDSFGILRYLDANWPEPRIYATTREGQREIEAWEQLARNGFGPVFGMYLNQFFAGSDDAVALASAQRLFDELVPRIEAALEGRDYLSGDAPNAADLTLAPFLSFALMDPEHEPERSVTRWVAARLQLSARFPLARAWASRVMELDPAWSSQ